MNLAIRSSIFPTQFKQAIITPIHKKGPQNDLGNKRPISCLPFLSKILERHLLDHISHFIHRNNILSNTQFGFRPLRNVEVAVSTMLDTILGLLEQKQRCLIISIDVEKAYDTINHRFLLHKLSHVGIRGSTLELLQSFLKDRSHRTVYKSMISRDDAICQVGVPQGALLSPLLFNIFVNDLLQLPHHAKVFAYADDTTIIFPYDRGSRAELDKINRCLDIICRWYEHNGLKLNLSKTQCMLLQVGTKPLQLDLGLRLRSTPLISYKDIDTLRILGVHFDSVLCWKTHCGSICKKLSFISAVIFKLKMLSVPRFILKRCYSALFLPYLIFAAPIWGFAAKTHIQRLVTLQNNVLRTIFNLKSSESVLEIMKRERILPVKLIVRCQTTKLIHRLTQHFKESFPTHFHETTLHRSRNRDDTTFFIPGVRLGIMQRSMFFEGIQHYNKLPRTTRLQENQRHFKKAVKKHYENEIEQLTTTAATPLTQRGITHNERGPSIVPPYFNTAGVKVPTETYVP